MLAFSSAVSFWQNQKNRRAILTLCGIPGTKRLRAPSRWGDTRAMEARMMVSVSLFKQETGWS
jgi:hypothetical protein